MLQHLNVTVAAVAIILIFTLLIMHTGIAGEKGQNIDNSVTINYLTLKFHSDFQ